MEFLYGFGIFFSEIAKLKKIFLINLIFNLILNWCLKFARCIFIHQIRYCRDCCFSQAAFWRKLVQD